MFYYLKGKVTRKLDNFIALDINGAGYKVFVSDSTYANLETGKETTIYTYTNIKEDIWDIYGFLDEKELALFEKLISVSGVGPKAGLSILSVLSPSDLISAIVSGDAKSISKAPGIGTKTAQRIILELKGKTKNDDILDFIVPQAKSSDNQNINETVNALVALGYSQSEARQAASFVESGSVEDMIKNSLRVLSQNNFSR